MFHLTFDPISIPVYGLAWTGYKAVWRWLWKDLQNAWRDTTILSR